MSEIEKWVLEGIEDGVAVVKLTSWRFFHDYVAEEFLDFPHYVWRGQRKASWALQSSFDRLIKDSTSKVRNRLAIDHLARFKMGSRGRRGVAPQHIAKDSEWWALAQHNGMSTPLLDWTESPFVALYFAFEEESENEKSVDRAVWGLGSVRAKNRQIEDAGEENLGPTLDLIRPMQDENLRLVSQSGLFTQLPPGMNVDDWIRTNFVKESKAMNLVKIVIPDVGRDECLRTLNRMNINHLSLFPDLYGVGKHCDNALTVPHYGAPMRD